MQRPGRFTTGKETSYPFIRGWVGPKAGLDALVLGKRTIVACYYNFNNPEQLLISQEGF